MRNLSICFYIVFISIAFFTSKTNFAFEPSNRVAKGKKTYLRRTFISGYVADCKYKDSVELLAIFHNPMKLDEMDYGQDTIVVAIRNGKFNFNFDIKNVVEVQFNISGKNLHRFGIAYPVSSFLFEPGDSIYIEFSDPFVFTNGVNYSKIFASGRGAAKFDCLGMLDKSIVVADNGSSLDIFKEAKRNLMEGFAIINQFNGKISPSTVNILKSLWIARLHFYTAGPVIEQIKGSDSLKYAYQRWITSLPSIDIRDANVPSSYFRVLKDKAIFSFMNRKGMLYDINKWQHYGLDDNEIYKILNASYSGYIRSWVLAKFLMDYNEELSEARLVCINRYLNSQKGDIFYSQVRSFLNSKNKTLPGNLAYNFSLPDTTGKLVSLSDFRGQVVLIDFFFRFCGGCQQMVPALEKVERYFRDKKVAFISISIDKTISEWKGGIGVGSVPTSIQLYTNGDGDRHPLIRYHEICSYPWLLLIDKKGRIVRSKAPDPRYDDGQSLKDLIEAQINEN